MTEHTGIWVGLLVMSLNNMAQNTKRHLTWLEKIFRVFMLHILSKVDKTFKWNAEKFAFTLSQLLQTDHVLQLVGYSKLL